MRLLSLFAKRYIAGITIDDAIRAGRGLNDAGLAAAIDNLGEDAASVEEAASAVAEYLSLIDAIAASRIDADISLKLTHLGAGISAAMAERNAGIILNKAAEHGIFVRFDMEGSRHTQTIIDVFRSLHERYPNSGLAIQSYLRRSASDIAMLTGLGASIRLVKGAYKEPPDIAFADKREVDANFSALMKTLLVSGTNPAIATHDERLIEETKRFAVANGISKDRFSFEMLLGIKRSLQRRLAAEGYRVRIYCPYGPDWMAYTARRLRERKENIWFVVKNIFD
ncbi:MAG: proline dehydrogenase family protein [Deltaproteobacteria bacterium]|nr:proline dehydrogenase family protein [Deltaproteobacteria bacterium]